MVEITDYIDQPHDDMSIFDLGVLYYSVIIVNDSPRYDASRSVTFSVRINDGPVLEGFIPWADIINAYNGEDISEDKESSEEDS